LAHPGGMRAADVFAAVDHAREGAILAVGPEGGFTDEEISLAASAGWRTVDLGPRILRVETAAIMLAALAAGRL
jgi:16S rRNA (uracil1498-N3)-methyltransferase